MGDQARGSCEHNHIIRRWVSTPIGFTVMVEMTDAGTVDAIGFEYAGVEGSDEHFAICRALAFVINELADTVDGAFLAADLIADLPGGVIADIERAILGEVAALQALRLPGLAIFPSSKGDAS